VWGLGESFVRDAGCEPPLTTANRRVKTRKSWVFFRRVDNKKRNVHMFEIHMLEAISISIINLNESLRQRVFLSPTVQLTITIISSISTNRFHSLSFFLKNTTQSNINLMTGKFSKEERIGKKKIDEYTYSSITFLF